jgi:HEAT repeat protein
MNELDGLLADLLSGDETRAEAAVPQLAALGEPARSALLDLSHSADVDGRWWAVRTLAATPQTRTEDLLPFLSDSAPEVRQAAALALSAHPDESAIPALIRALRDEDSMVGSLAGNALVQVGTASVPSLLEVLNEAPQAVRILALRALSELKDHRAIPAMMKVMDEESALLQYWAGEGLERLGLNMVYIKPT